MAKEDVKNWFERMFREHFDLETMLYDLALELHERNKYPDFIQIPRSDLIALRPCDAMTLKPRTAMVLWKPR